MDPTMVVEDPVCVLSGLATMGPYILNNINGNEWKEASTFLILLELCHEMLDHQKMDLHMHIDESLYDPSSLNLLRVRCTNKYKK